MKKTVALAIVFAFVLAFVTPVFASSKPVDKAYHGVEQIVKAPKHLIDDPIHEYQAAKFKPFGLFGGVLKGMGYTVVETVHGMMDIVTSPFTLLEK